MEFGRFGKNDKATVSGYNKKSSPFIRDPVYNVVRHLEQQSEPVGDKNKDY